MDEKRKRIEEYVAEARRQMVIFEKKERELRAKILELHAELKKLGVPEEELIPLPPELPPDIVK